MLSNVVEFVKRNYGWIIAGVVVLIAGALLVSGCSQEQIEKIKSAVTNTRTQVQQLELIEDEMETQLEVAYNESMKYPPGPERDRAIEVYEKIQRALEQVRNIHSLGMLQLERLELALGNAQDEVDVINGVLVSIGPSLPVQYQPYIALGLLGTTLLGGIWRAIRTSNKLVVSESLVEDAKKVVQAIDEAKVGGVVDFTSPAAVKTLNGIMGDGGKAFVNMAQGK